LKNFKPDLSIEVDLDIETELTPAELKILQEILPDLVKDVLWLACENSD
jgi:hypothetical protein